MNFHKFLLVVIFISGCNGKSTAMGEGELIKNPSISGQITDGDFDKCLQVVRAYVRLKRGWKDEDYRVVQEQLSDDSRGFSVRHEDDETPLPAGGLKSFHVDLDRSCGAVTAELAYQ